MKSTHCGQLQPLEDTRRETTQARLVRHTSSYYGPGVEAWVMFTTEQLVSNNKKFYYTNLVIQLQVKSLIHTWSSVWLMYCKQELLCNNQSCLRTRLNWHICCYEAREKKAKRLWGLLAAQCSSSVGRAMVARGSGFDTHWFGLFAFFAL